MESRQSCIDSLFHNGYSICGICELQMISHIMSIMGAIILCFVVIYFAQEHDIPRKFSLHGYECSGQIGGGCEKN